eukprot:830592-Pleurochrysis_carterae.AAC.1
MPGKKKTSNRGGPRDNVNSRGTNISSSAGERPTDSSLPQRQRAAQRRENESTPRVSPNDATTPTAENPSNANGDSAAPSYPPPCTSTGSDANGRPEHPASGLSFARLPEVMETAAFSVEDVAHNAPKVVSESQD